MFLCDDVLGIIFEFLGKTHVMYVNKQFYNIRKKCIISLLTQKNILSLRQSLNINNINKLKKICEFVIINKIKVDFHCIDKHNNIFLGRHKILSEILSPMSYYSCEIFCEIKYIIIDIILIDLGYNIYPKKYLSDSIFIKNYNICYMDIYYPTYDYKINELKKTFGKKKDSTYKKIYKNIISFVSQRKVMYI